MTAPIFVDSNVLVYRHDLAAGGKQAQAASWLHYLWSSRRGRLSWQVLEEFYVNATQKLKPGLARDVAREEVLDLAAWGPIAIDSRSLSLAWQIQDRFGLSFWDALIVAGARLAGCASVLTEDLQHGQNLDGVRVVSPFEEEPPSDLL